MESKSGGRLAAPAPASGTTGMDPEHFARRLAPDPFLRAAIAG